MRIGLLCLLDVPTEIMHNSLKILALENFAVLCKLIHSRSAVFLIV